MAREYYGEPMAGFSVIASEHSVMCSYGGRKKEPEAYQKIIDRVKKKCMNVNPASGVIILSLVSDTYNIYNVCYRILPALQAAFIGWKNNHGIGIKIVVRPDSGTAKYVLFGYEEFESAEFQMISSKVQVDMDIDIEEARRIVRMGIFNILFEKFGYSVNSKGCKVFHPQIGVLQGDGVDYTAIVEFYEIMLAKKLDIMNLVLGSGGAYLQNHKRDDQKWAIKATHVIIAGEGIAIEKNPITDATKKSKHDYLKLVRTGPSWKDFVTLQHGDPGFDEAIDEMITVFLNGELVKEYEFSEVRKNAEILESEYI